MSVDQSQQPSSSAISSQQASARWLELVWFLPLSCLLLCLIAYIPVFFAPAGHTVSSWGNDGSQYFVYAREFGFSELRHGHLALWNPYIFSGCPFMGNWQSALLYPPNWVYLFMPLGAGLDTEAFIHTWLCATGMAFWARRTGVGQLPALAAGASVAFGAPYMLHVYAGHFSMLDALAWTPWILLAVENLLDTPSLRWTLAATAALALQVLSGHPQSVFGTAIAGGLYVLCRIWTSPKKLQTLACFVGIVIGAGLLSSAQLVASLATKAESVRQVGVSYHDATNYSLTWGSLATFFAPKLFGDMTPGHLYWGSSFMWETSAYIGTAMIGFALFALLQAKTRQTWIYAGLAVVFILLSMAGHAPLFKVFYTYVPGFSQFRAQGRFIFFAGMFLALLGANGLELLLKREFKTASVYVFLVLGVVCLGLAIYGHSASLVIHTQGASIKSIFFQNAALVASANQFACAALIVSGAILLLAGVLVFMAKARPSAGLLACLVVIIELTGYAFSTMTTFDINSAQMPPKIQNYLQGHPGDYRISNQVSVVDSAVSARVDDIGGYDPSSMQRTTDFLNAARATSTNGPSSLYRLLRLRYSFIPGPNGTVSGVDFNNPLPHAFIAPSWVVQNGRDAVLGSVISQTSPSPQAPPVVLESDPPFNAPPPPIAGEVAAASIDTDTTKIVADVTQPSLIVITDPYSVNWHATGLPGSSQTAYAIMPCDWAFMAIPVNAGHHEIELHYEPSGLKPALFIMGASWLILLCLSGFDFAKRRRTTAQAI